MRKRKQLLSLVINQPWAMKKETLEQAVKLMGSSVKELHAAANGSFEANGDVLELAGDVAVINITGPITRYEAHDSMSARDGYATVESLMSAFDMAVEDPGVGGILLNVNSPGGSIDGISEMSDKIFKARGKKPIVAYVGGYMASAAYWIGSAADKIIAEKTAEVGSIGVYCAYIDDSKAMENAGFKEVVIVSSQSPNKIASPQTETGLQIIQARIDEYADIFLADVSRNRGVSYEHALENFGQGDTFIGQKAKDAGMVDSIGTFETALETLKAKAENKQPRYGAEIKGGSEMTLEQLKAEFPDVATALMEEGAAAERARIQSIEEIAGADNSDVVRAVKFDGKTDAGQAAILILKEQKASRAAIGEKRKADAAEIPEILTGTPADKAEDAIAGVVAAANKKRGGAK